MWAIHACREENLPALLHIRDICSPHPALPRAPWGHCRAGCSRDNSIQRELRNPGRAPDSQGCTHAPSPGLSLTSTRPKWFPLPAPLSSTVTPQLPPSSFPTLTQPCCCSLLLPQVQGWVREVLAVSPRAAEAADTADSSGTRLHSLLLTGMVGGVPSHKLQWRCAQHTHPGKQHRVLLTLEPAFVGYSSNDSARDDGKL